MKKQFESIEAFFEKNILVNIWLDKPKFKFSLAPNVFLKHKMFNRFM